MNETEELRQSILAQVAEFYQKAHAERPFTEGETAVQYAGRIFDENEMQYMVSAVLDFWLTAGPYAEKFEEQLGQFLGVREVIPVNSGSSANCVSMYGCIAISTESFSDCGIGSIMDVIHSKYFSRSVVNSDLILAASGGSSTTLDGSLNVSL